MLCFHKHPLCSQLPSLHNHRSCWGRWLSVSRLVNQPTCCLCCERQQAHQHILLCHKLLQLLLPVIACDDGCSWCSLLLLLLWLAELLSSAPA